DRGLFLEVVMRPDPAPAAVHLSRSEPFLRHLIGGISVFTMRMPIPQGLTIWIGRQAAGVSLMSWSAYLASAILWFWFGIQKQDTHIYLPCVGGLKLDMAGMVGVLIYG